MPTATAPDMSTFSVSPANYAQVRTVQIPESTLTLGTVGTGGMLTKDVLVQKFGYSPYFRYLITLKNSATRPDPAGSPFKTLIDEIQDGFGRTFSSLPRVFGVSRQTLYNWKAGETPNRKHHEKLYELADAALVFQEAGFKPDAAALDRVIANSQSFIERMQAGANGRECAQKLIRMMNRRKDSLAALEAIIPKKPCDNHAETEWGLPTYNEES